MNRNLATVALAAASLGGAVSWHFATEHAARRIRICARRRAFPDIRADG